MIFVLAGNKQQFGDYVKYKAMPKAHFSYISGPTCLRGLLKTNLVAVGTWYDRPDIREIEDEALYRHMSILEDNSW